MRILSLKNGSLKNFFFQLVRFGPNLEEKYNDYIILYITSLIFIRDKILSKVGSAEIKKSVNGLRGKSNEVVVSIKYIFDWKFCIARRVIFVDI